MYPTFSWYGFCRYRPGHDLPEPESGRAEKHREFIKAKYVDKRWFGTPEDIEKDREREVEREAAKAKRNAERSDKLGAASSGAARKRVGGAGRTRKGTADRGLRKVASPASAPAVPVKTADLLDFLTDDPAPAPLATAALPVATAPTPPSASPSQSWGAFGGSGGVGGVGGSSWATFGDTPGLPQTVPASPQQQPHQQQGGAFPFQRQEVAPTVPASAGFGATDASPSSSSSSYRGASFSTNFPPPPPGGRSGGQGGMQPLPPPQQPQPQQQAWPQQQPQEQPQTVSAFPAFGSTPAGGSLPGAAGVTVGAMSPPVKSPSGAQLQPQGQGQQHQQQQGFGTMSGGFVVAGSGVQGSAPIAPVQQQPQQAGGLFLGPPSGMQGVCVFLFRIFFFLWCGFGLAALLCGAVGVMTLIPLASCSPRFCSSRLYIIYLLVKCVVVVLQGWLEIMLLYPTT